MNLSKRKFVNSFAEISFEIKYSKSLSITYKVITRYKFYFVKKRKYLESLHLKIMYDQNRIIFKVEFHASYIYFKVSQIISKRSITQC